jgi:CubicO group peptidase (beta-lactamase class C family)
MPATNGICTARALARFYAALIGEVDGHRILTPGTLTAATAEQANGIDRILRMPVRIGTGFGLPTPDAFWYSPTAFGFPGRGGSLGFADPATGLAFGYVMNHVLEGVPDLRAANLLAAVRRARAVRQVIVKRFPTTVPYVLGMPSIGLVEIIFAFLIPLAALWLVIYTAVRAAIRHSK